MELENASKALSIDPAVPFFLLLYGSPFWLWLLFRTLSALIRRVSNCSRVWADQIQRNSQLPNETTVPVLVLRVEGDEASGALWVAQAAARLISTTWSTVVELVEESLSAQKAREDADFKTMMARGGSVLDLPKRLPIAGAILLLFVFLWQTGDFSLRLLVLLLSPGLLFLFPRFGALIVMMVALPCLCQWSVFLLPYGWEFVLSSIALDVRATASPPGGATLHQLPRARLSLHTWKAWAIQRLRLLHSGSYREPEALNLLVTWIHGIDENLRSAAGCSKKSLKKCPPRVK